MLIHDGKLKQLLLETKTIAILGAKDSPTSPVDAVGRYMIGQGYRVLPVHPARKTVWGLPVFRNLSDIDEPVDIVNLFRAAQFCPAHAEETLTRAPLPKCFWMQSGIFSAEARSILKGSGVLTVEDRCLMVEHRRLLA